jgi:hypothetical protein
MALNQRETILASLPDHGFMLEWGGGGSTGWFLDHMGGGQSLLTVEHHAGWAGTMWDAYRHHAHWQLKRAPGTLEVGQNATHWEECPAGLTDYICPPALADADVVLVDGVARSACLAAAVATGKPGRVIYVHDVQRKDWYEWPLRVYADRIVHRRVIEPAPGDYPAKLMEIRL